MTDDYKLYKHVGLFIEITLKNDRTKATNNKNCMYLIFPGYGLRKNTGLC